MDDVFEPMFEPMDRGSLEVIRRLEAYADARLEPTGSATSRMRAAVMVAAHRRAAQLAADAMSVSAAVSPAVASLPSEPDAGRRRSWLDAVAWRRPAAAIVAGCLTLGILAGTALAVRPGGMLYQARIWTEAATLPAADQELARAQAEIHRLGARLQEAEAAADAADGPALVAALDAYAAIVTEAATGTADDPAAAQALRFAIEQHMVILSQLAITAPAPAQAALNNAILASTEALDDIDGGHGGPGVSNGSGPATNNGNGPATNNGNGPATNNGTGAPGSGGNEKGGTGDGASTASPKPDATPAPEPTATPKPPKPTPTAPSHDRNPAPTPTHQPPGQQGGDSSGPPSQDQQ